MALNAREVKNTGGKKYDPMDAGNYPARLVQVIDLGVQPQEYQGEEKPPKREIMVTYEFLDEFLPGEDGEPDETKPRWLSERFALNNLQSEKAKSTQRYYALDPDEEEGGDWFALIGRPCAVTVVTYVGKDKVERNKVGSISAMRPKDAQKAPELVNEPKVFDTEEPDAEIFRSLPDWVQKIIQEGLEWQGLPEGGEVAKGKEKAAGKVPKGRKEAVPEDEIPFDKAGPDEGDGDNW